MKRHELLPACSAAVVVAALATFAVEIPVEVPERGYVSVQIRNASGDTVGNVITQEPLEKGKGVVDWDLTGPDDGVRQGEGKYTYSAVWIPEHTLAYRGCFYPTPLPDGTTPWHTGAGAGG